MISYGFKLFGGGGTGGGVGSSLTTEVLFNNAGVVDGDPGLTYDATTDTLTVGFVSGGSFIAGANIYGGDGISFTDTNSTSILRWGGASGYDSGLRRVSAGLIGVTSGGSNLGSLQAGNYTATALATPAITSPLTVNGTPGATTYGYKAVAFLNDGTSTAASAEVTVATGPATLNGTDNITVATPAVANMAYYNLYRTTPLPLVKVYSGTAPSYVDIGTDLGAATLPTANTTGRILVGDGSAAAPSVSTPTGSGLFHFSNVAQVLGFSAAGSSTNFGLQAAAGPIMNSNASISWTTAGYIGDAVRDLTIRPVAAATLQLGNAPNGTPVANTLIVGESGSGTDIAGANGVIQSGAGTSDATGSSLIFKTPTDSGSTGSVAQTQDTRLTINQLGIVPAAPFRLPFGAIYWSAGAAAANEPNTPIKVAGTTAALGTNYEVTQATTNRLTYTGTLTRSFVVTATFSVDCSAATSLIMYLYKGGAAITGASISRTVGGTDIGAMAIHAVVSLATNEYVELWCETNDGDNVNVPLGQLSIRSLD